LAGGSVLEEVEERRLPRPECETFMSATHHLILALLFLVVGCCVGSFVNVCASRIPRGLSVLRPRSHCPQCKTAIRARDNVPILGWLILRGRCRACRATIPSRYLFVELGVGLSFATVYLARAAVARGDLWEQSGFAVVLGQLLMLWSAISVAVAAILTTLDVRASSIRPARTRGVSRQDQGLSWRDRACGGDAILVQFGDFVGPARISQVVSGDATESFVRADDVNRPGAPPGGGRDVGS
jgi:Bacterial Peptidase A24 N-terminal domain